MTFTVSAGFASSVPRPVLALAMLNEFSSGIPAQSGSVGLGRVSLVAGERFLDVSWQGGKGVEQIVGLLGRRCCIELRHVVAVPRELGRQLGLGDVVRHALNNGAVR
jgi:hypothetical protein